MSASCPHTSGVRKVQRLPEERQEVGVQICVVEAGRYLSGSLDVWYTRYHRESLSNLAEDAPKGVRLPAFMLASLAGLDSSDC